MPTDRVPQCHISTAQDHLRGWRVPLCPAPLHHLSLREEIAPNIQPETFARDVFKEWCVVHTIHLRDALLSVTGRVLLICFVRILPHGDRFLRLEHTFQRQGLEKGKLYPWWMNKKYVGEGCGPLMLSTAVQRALWEV